MVLEEFLLAVAIGLVLSVVLIMVFRRQRPGAKGYWSSQLYLFLLLFAANWAGGVWFGPSKPENSRWFWVPFAVSGLVIALILLTLLTVLRPRSPDEAEQAATVQTGLPGVVTVVVWVLVIALSISIVAHYAQT